MDVKNLWIKRVKEYWLQASRYIQYMLNSLIYTFIITLIIAAYYYAGWLRTLDETFPYPFVIAIIIAVALTLGKVRTFLKEPDKVFLLPLEIKLATYFRYSLLYSIVFHFIYLGLLLLALAPLYDKYELASDKTFMFIIVAVLLLKIWNLLMKWYISRIFDKTYHRADFIVRFTVNFLLIYFLIMNAHIAILFMMFAIVISYYFYFKRKVSNAYRLQWEYLIRMEEESVSSFYRLANLFTDVPQLKTKVKARRIVTSVVAFIFRKDKQAFSFLYWRAFIRTGDYLALYIRLIIVGSILLIFIPNEIAKVAIFVLFLYLSGFQLLSLWKLIDIKLWVHLYPIRVEERRKAFHRWHKTLLVIQSIILIMLLAIIGTSPLMLAVSVILGFSFIQIYSRFALRHNG